MIKRLITISVLLLTAGAVFAQTTWNVKITNLTKSQIFSPPLAVSHSNAASLFTLGQPASPGLALMAEDGDSSMLAAELSGSDEVLDVVAAGGPVMPGSSVTIEVEAGGRMSRISVAGMLVITNDAFFAADSIGVPVSLYKSAGLRGPIQVMALAYDAGSEANSESCSTIPGPPCGSGGVRDTDGAEGYVYIHNGVHGIGDIDPASYSWDGPVALVEISRNY